MTIRKSIGTWGLLATAIGGIIGSGWLFGPYFVAKMAGPSAIVAWVLGGLLMMVITLTFAELSSAFPMVGGSVRYLQLSHGTLVSYTMAWISWLSAAAVAPIETLALTHYISTYIPALMYKSDGVHLLTGVGFLLAAAIMLIMCFINVLGVKLLAKTNNIMVIIKLAIPLITIFVLFFTDFHFKNTFIHGFMPAGVKGILMSLSLAGVIFSYIGYTPAIQLAGEAKNPQVAIPIAVIGALIVSIVIYLLLQITFIGALRPQDFAHGWQNLSFQGDSGPFVGIAKNLGAAWLVGLIIFGAIVAPFGTGLLYTAATARTVYAMGDNGYLFKGLMKLNRFGIPVRIIAINYVIGLFLFLPFPTWQKMVGFLVSSLIFGYAVGPLALVVLRKILPNQHRPFRVPFPRIVCIFAFYICNLIIYWTGWEIIWKMLCAILIGYIVLALFKLTKQGHKLKLDWAHGWWVLFYIVAIGLVSLLGSFGSGLNVIPFGWDFLVIAVVSWIIYEMAQWLARTKVEEHEYLSVQEDIGKS